MQTEEIKRLTELSLSEEIAHAQSIITEGLERFQHDELYIAWTGGKDSTTMLWLYREACNALGKPLPKTMFIDEGSVFEEIWELVEVGTPIEILP